jgi:glutaryl-CoA dehydrogenase
MAVISALADEEQKQRWLPPAIKFEKIICFGLTEPHNGSDATGL